MMFAGNNVLLVSAIFSLLVAGLALDLSVAQHTQDDDEDDPKDRPPCLKYLSLFRARR